MTARLFDPLPFSKPDPHTKRGKARKSFYKDEKVAKPKPEPEIRRIELGTVWRLTRTPDKHGCEVHAFRKMAGDMLATVCDEVRVPLTFDPGTPAAACPECWKRGAR